ncbi:hypothetical protein GCM10028785_25300 [Hydrogenophaga soli]
MPVISLNTVPLPANWINQRPPNVLATPAEVSDVSALTLPVPESERETSIHLPAQVSLEGELFLQVTQLPSTLLAPEKTYGPNGRIHVKAGQMQVWEQASDNPLGQLMGRNAAKGSMQNRLKGLGEALLDQVSNRPVAYRQSVVNVKAPDAASKIQSVAIHSLQEFQSSPSSRVELSVQTRSGAHVRLTLVDKNPDENDPRGSGLSVEIEVDGELTQADKAALKSLASGFEKAIQGLADDTTQIDLQGLTNFDHQVISTLELKTQVHGRDARGIRYEKLAADFKVDANSREIQLKRPDGTVKMKTDLRQPVLWGNQEQKAYSLNQYLRRMDQAAQRGHANRELVDLFKSTFMAVNASYGSPAAAPLVNPSKADSAANLASDAAAWREEDTSVLTGLADFDASVTATPKASNPRNVLEKDKFQYSINQSTVISGPSKSNRAITQTQDAQLSASYHQSLFSSRPPLLDDKKTSQNYFFHQIEDHSSTLVHLAYDKDELRRATLTQSSSQSHRVQKYEDAKLTQDIRTPPRLQVKHTDLLPLFKQLHDPSQPRQINEERKKQLLDGLHAQVFDTGAE